jgi:hypothetical protein
MISDLQGYVSTRVKELIKGNQKPMMAMPTTGGRLSNQPAAAVMARGA